LVALYIPSILPDCGRDYAGCAVTVLLLPGRLGPPATAHYILFSLVGLFYHCSLRSAVTLLLRWWFCHHFCRSGSMLRRGPYLVTGLPPGRRILVRGPPDAYHCYFFIYRLKPATGTFLDRLFYTHRIRRALVATFVPAGRRASPLPLLCSGSVRILIFVCSRVASGVLLYRGRCVRVAPTNGSFGVATLARTATVHAFLPLPSAMPGGISCFADSTIYLLPLYLAFLFAELYLLRSPPQLCLPPCYWFLTCSPTVLSSTCLPYCAAWDALGLNRQCKHFCSWFALPGFADTERLARSTLPFRTLLLAFDASYATPSAPLLPSCCSARTPRCAQHCLA